MKSPDKDLECGLRERKKRATRQALRAAATRLVAIRGLDAVGVDEIALEAGVSTRTFFNYFPSKEDALVGWDPDVIAAMLRAIQTHEPGASPFHVLRRALTETFAGFDAAPSEVRDRLQIIQSEPQLLADQTARWGELERTLTASLDSRKTSDAVAPHNALLVATALAACRVATMTWCSQEPGRPLTAYVARNLDALEHGLICRAGLVSGDESEDPPDDALDDVSAFSSFS